MPVRMEVKVLNEVDPFVAHALLYLQDWRAPLRTAGAHMHRSFMAQFRAEGIPRWPPHAVSTWIRRVGDPIRHLRKHQALLRSPVKPTRGETDKAYAKRIAKGFRGRKPRESWADYRKARKSWLQKRRPETMAQAQKRRGKQIEASLRKLNPKLLQDTGRLRRSYTGRGAESIYVLTTSRLVFGSAVKYANIHQHGGLSGKNHRSLIPARPLTILDIDRKEIRRIFTRHVARALKP